MPIVSIDKIIVEDRARKDLGDLTDLMASIEKYGLIHPIVLSPGHKLIAGHRRLQAFRNLGRTEIDVTWKTATGGEHYAAAEAEMELHENIHRKSMTEAEKSECLAKYLRLRQIRSTEVDLSGKKVIPSIRQVAREAGVGKDTLREALRVMAIVSMMPELRGEESVAKIFSKFSRAMSEKLLARIAKLTEGEAKTIVKQIDCREGLKGIEDKSIKLILTDIPYNLDVTQLASESWLVDNRHRASYFDPTKDLDESLSIIKDTVEDLWRILDTGCHLYACCTFDQFQPFRAILSSRGFLVRPAPLIWNKTNGFNPNFGRSFPFCYECMLFATKGPSRQMATGPKIDVFEYAVPSKKLHINEKPIGLWKELLLYSSYPGEQVLDPFCGSGSALVAAISLGRKAIGFDNSEYSISVATNRISEALRGEELKGVQKTDEVRDVGDFADKLAGAIDKDSIDNDGSAGPETEPN